MSRVVGGRYELLKKLGAGGMGAVYLARHTTTYSHCALKLIHDHAEDGNSHARFLREARAPAEIGHPGIVQVLDAGIDADGTMFVAMELLSGQSYRGVVQRTDVSLEEKVSLLLDALDPLAVAHRKGFVHRDLKPENLFVLSSPGAGPRVKLLDFGIARDGGAMELTETGVLVGSVKYVAPEQARSARDASPASDVWSVGVMLYELAFGDVPFSGQSSFDVIVKIHAGKFVPLRERAPEVPAAYEALVHRCLDQEPSARPRDAAELAIELAPILEGGLPDATPGWPSPLRSPSSEKRRVDASTGSGSRRRAVPPGSSEPPTSSVDTGRGRTSSESTDSSADSGSGSSSDSRSGRRSSPDLAWLTPKPSQRRAKGMTIVPLLRHVHAMRRAGVKLTLTPRDEDLLSQRLIVSDWYPFEVWTRLLELQAEGCRNDLTMAEEMGRLGATELIGSVHRSFVTVGDPRRSIRALSRMWSRYFDFGEVHVVDLGDDSARVTITGYSDMPPWYAHMALGWVIALVELSGSRVREHRMEEVPWKNDGRYRIVVCWK
ncbi:MAG: TIGR02265 family protein [Sandaracinus sp.]|nr:TIGR02265 family protein [Sandaracinus sp.]MCB9624845.1 TIGR02265 family protein [Sandaracinus sp.]MCB9635358.1 TIGR02265 family protein [Sandaracinus sp.]